MSKRRPNRLIIWGFAVSMGMPSLCTSAIADCQNSAITPVTVTDETSSIPASSQLVNGTGTVVNTSTPGQASVNLPNSGVTAGSYTNSSITVNGQGIVTSASNGTGSGSQLGKTLDPQRRYVNIAPLASGVGTIDLWGCGTLQVRGSQGNAVVQQNRLIVPLSAPSTNNNEFAFINSSQLSNSLSLKPTFSWIFSPDVLTNVRMWVGLGGPNPYNTDNPNSFIAFRFSPTTAGDTHLIAYTGDDTGGGGAHATTVSTGVTLSASTPVWLCIDCSSGTSANFYVNGTLKATISTTLPGSSTPMVPVIFETNLLSGQQIVPGIGSMYTEMY